MSDFINPNKIKEANQFAVNERIKTNKEVVSLVIMGIIFIAYLIFASFMSMRDLQAKEKNRLQQYPIGCCIKIKNFRDSHCVIKEYNPKDDSFSVRCAPSFDVIRFSSFEIEKCEE